MRAFFFRGRNTAAIIDDARFAGVVSSEATIIVVARKGDTLAEPGDVTPDEVSFLTSSEDDYEDEIVLVANGGTTAQVVPLVARLAETATRWDAEADDSLRHPKADGARHAFRAWTWRVYDVQRDGVALLVGDPPPKK